jgi:two-component system NtrC family sensor kinase
MALRTRLIIGVSLVVALVLGVESVVEIRLFEETAERELRETGLVTAQFVADDLELRAVPLQVDELTSDLHEFAQSAPSVRAVSIVQLSDGAPTILASTTSTESPAALALAQDTLTRGDQGWRDAGGVSRVALRAAPAGGAPAAVVVTMSLSSIAQLRTRGRIVSLWLVPIAIVVLIFVLDQILRRIIYAPVAALRETMTRAGTGDFTARASVFRADEMGALARGFNDMLERVSGFNQALEERVSAVTAALDQSHEQRVESYRQMLVMRDALAEADRLATIGQTAASVAHQVGTPLNLISGHVQVLLAQPDLSPDLARRLRLVLDQIGRVGDAIRGLLEHTRRPRVAAAIDVPGLLDSIANLVRPRLTAAGITLHKEVAASLPAIRGHRDELEMALLNLFTNAIDAMPGGGVLQVAASVGPEHQARNTEHQALSTGHQALSTEHGAPSTKPDAPSASYVALPSVVITVSDTGAGISSELLLRVFDPWVTTKPKGRGTGLGLSITKDVVTRLGGTVRVSSAAGQGATFTITLPADSNEPGNDADPLDR